MGSDNQGWAAVLNPADLAALGTMRLEQGLAILETSDEVWVRGPQTLAGIAERLRSLPLLEIFELGALEELRPAGAVLPVRKLPEGNWQALATAFPLSWPASHKAAEVCGRVPLTLVRTADFEPSTYLMVARQTGLDFAERAPAIRLNSLRFAAAADGRILFCGAPLPPINGTQYWRQGALLVPGGYRFEPPLGGAVIENLLALEEGQLALFQPDGTYEVLDEQSFVKATRANLRLTAAALPAEPPHV